jgi:hypothetical protein
MSIFHRIAIVFHIVIEGRISTIYHLICIESSERKLILDNTAFSYYISVETVEVQSFLTAIDSSEEALTFIEKIIYTTFLFFKRL